MQNNFSKDELIRYSRHFVLPEIGADGQKRLKDAKVLCVGAGGLGSSLLLYLAGAGVGNIGIVEDDIVDLGNLQRQILYSSEDIRKKKVEIAKSKLKKLNPNINVIAHDEKLTEANALTLIDQYDLIADCTDNFATRYITNDACFKLKKPNVYGSVFQFEGQCSVFNLKDAPCYRCLYNSPPKDGLVPGSVKAGILGMLPGVFGNLQAIEVMKIILNIGKPLVGRLLTFNALSMRFSEFKIDKNPKCSLCS